ncbi:hypothetical protein MUA96_04130 [Mammaliicoccus sciuri]|uniref:hypothetical protein n=2 Tax=Mammaliicoccus sciuri TaxID=1296 RepID=UPI0021D3A450|nr:hypothetical protein [Mammaliicoccus sciuri]UXV27463.1 hypothetical protein MUA96_04130 [Mammaliicoccus sciuri]
MPTIKTKKRMNKKEYAQFLIDNADIIEITAGYRDLEKYVLNIKLEPLNNKTKAISKDILEVEIEEEITEDTVIPKMLVIYYKNAAHIQINKNLNFLIKDNLKSVYIMNDDLTMTLIWTIEKGLVD